jgi:hypothetical protein
MKKIPGFMETVPDHVVSRRSFVLAAAAAATYAPLSSASRQKPDAVKQRIAPQDSKGMFAWSFPAPTRKQHGGSNPLASTDGGRLFARIAESNGYVR